MIVAYALASVSTARRSNDANQLLGEARQAMLLQRVGWPGFESRADRFSAREALELATRGGAASAGS